MKLLSKSGISSAIAALTLFSMAVVATACAAEPQIITKEVVVEKVVTEIKEVPVEKVVETIKEVVKVETVEVPGETKVIEKVRTVIETVEVPGKTVVVEKEVIKEIVGETVVVEKEVIVIATPEPVQIAVGGQNYGGTLKIGTVDFGTMDPALMGLSTGSAQYSNLAYDNLTEPWYDGSIMNRLAEEWSASDDLSVYTIKTRQGVTFHDGKALTSADVKYTFDRILNPDTASPLLEQINYISEITTPDASTVVFTLAGANINHPYLLADYHARIVPDGATSEQLTTGEYGSGPYTLGEHNPTERTILHKYENYWIEGKPFIDRVIYFYMPEQTTRLEALKSGAIDILIGPNFASIPGLEANSEISLKQTSTASIRNLVMDTREGSIFADKNLRKALQYAIDRDLVRQAALFQYGENANDHPIGKNDPMYWDDQPLISQDIEKAREYLTAAGYGEGNPVSIELNAADFSQMLDVSLAVKASLDSTGLPINIEVKKHESSTYWESVWMNDGYPLTVSAWNGRPAAEAVTVALKGGGVWNETYFNNPRMDELLALSATEGDYVARLAQWQEIQEILIEEVPAVYLMYTPFFVAHTNRVRGVKAHPRNWTFVEDWWIQN